MSQYHINLSRDILYRSSFPGLNTLRRSFFTRKNEDRHNVTPPIQFEMPPKSQDRPEWVEKLVSCDQRKTTNSSDPRITEEEMFISEIRKELRNIADTYIGQFDTNYLHSSRAINWLEGLLAGHRSGNSEKVWSDNELQVLKILLHFWRVENALRRLRKPE